MKTPIDAEESAGMLDLTLIVMAAGSSRRYGRLKQIDRLGPSGESMLEYSVFDALRAGFSRVVFVIREEIEQDFREAVGKQVENEVETRYVFQRPPGTSGATERSKPWGTAHAVLSAESQINGPFAVVNADDFYGPRSFTALAGHFGGQDPSSALVGFPLRNTLSRHGGVTRGICRLSADRSLVSVDETFDITADGDAARYLDHDGVGHDLTGDEIVSMNMWGFGGDIFTGLRAQWREFVARHGDSPTAEFFIPDAVSALISSAQLTVRVLETPEHWFGVTYIEDRSTVVANLEQLVSQGVYPQRLWAG